MDWTAERVTELRRRRAAGERMRGIARLWGVSPNVVIGKCHRLELMDAILAEDQRWEKQPPPAAPPPPPVYVAPPPDPIKSARDCVHPDCRLARQPGNRFGLCAGHDHARLMSMRKPAKPDRRGMMQYLAAH